VVPVVALVLVAVMEVVVIVLTAGGVMLLISRLPETTSSIPGMVIMPLIRSLAKAPSIEPDNVLLTASNELAGTMIS
jgi:hypothetical protein